MTGLHLIATATTPALRRARFGGDDNLDEGGHRAALALSQTLRGTPTEPTPTTTAPRRLPTPHLIAPSHAARQTATALGITHPTTEPALTDPDHGTWTGHTLDQIDPTDLHTWLTDPAANPHAGESLTDLHTRATTWLHTAPHTATAIAHPMIIRALLAAALELPAAAIRRLEVAPLSVTRLTHHGHWHLHLPSA